MVKKPTEVEIIEKLNSAIIWAKYHYLQHRQLFVQPKRPQVKKILSSTSSSFFSELNGLYWDRMILDISCLTDPYTDGKNKNLSMDYLRYISEINSMNCKNAIRKRYDELLLLATPIRHYRSKIVAHPDLKSKFYSSLKVHITEIEKCFNLIQLMMNDYHLEKSDTQWSFDMSGWHDVGSLIYHLEQSLIYENIKKNRRNWNLDQQEEEEWKSSLA